MYFCIFHSQTCSGPVCWGLCPRWLVRRKIAAPGQECPSLTPLPPFQIRNSIPLWGADRHANYMRNDDWKHIFETCVLGKPASQERFRPQELMSLLHCIAVTDANTFFYMQGAFFMFDRIFWNSKTGSGELQSLCDVMSYQMIACDLSSSRCWIGRWWSMWGYGTVVKEPGCYRTEHPNSNSNVMTLFPPDPQFQQLHAASDLPSPCLLTGFPLDLQSRSPPWICWLGFQFLSSEGQPPSF